MAAARIGIIIAAVVVSLGGAVCGGLPPSLTLERAFPVKDGNVNMSQLVARDRVRHGRMLQTTFKDIIDFPVDGTFDPFLVGLYYTKVQLGNPAKEFYVQIDTGSDVLWVGCASCSGCPDKSGLQISMNAFDPSSSTSAKKVSCSDDRCNLEAQTTDAVCSASTNQCTFTFQYGDGSQTAGYYVSDTMYFDTVSSNQTSASVVFGCSTQVSGELTKSDRAVNGIFGFGQQQMSVISQLASQGVSPNAFSHCLKGDSSGGSVLVLGEVVEPNMVYSPLVPSQTHYNLNLLSIAVDGQNLSVDSSVFTTSTTRGTIIDSGTTLAYLPEEAFDPFVNAITSAVSQSAQPVTAQGTQCYIITSSVDSVFPQVTFNFEGASMKLDPEDYLLQQKTTGGAEAWCIGFLSGQGQTLTILGDIVLKNKVIVYDLANQRIGWVNYDCSKTVNVSTTSTGGTKEFVNAGQVNDNSSSSRIMPPKLTSQSIPAFILLVSILGSLWLL